MIRNCALCGISYELKELSHILPAFVYRWLKNTSVTGFMRYGPRMNRRDQDGIKDYFLCEACEDCFARYERVFASQIFYPLIADAFAEEKGRLTHFRSRHAKAIAQALTMWRDYLLGLSNDIGKHEIHLLPFLGVADYTGENAPPNLNTYLWRTVAIDTIVSDDQAVTFCKLGPLILCGIIEYPNPEHWQNTKIEKTGTIEPRETVTPAQYGNYIFKKCYRLQELEADLSDRQLRQIDLSYTRNAAKIASSGTYLAAMSDFELQQRKED